MNKYTETDGKPTPKISAVSQSGNNTGKSRAIDRDENLTGVQVENLHDYISGLYNGAKPTKSYRNSFATLTEYKLNIREQENLLNLSQEKDKSYKILLVLVDILMEQETLSHSDHQASPREDAMILSVIPSHTLTN